MSKTKSRPTAVTFSANGEDRSHEVDDIHGKHAPVFDFDLLNDTHYELEFAKRAELKFRQVVCSYNRRSAKERGGKAYHCNAHQTICAVAWKDQKKKKTDFAESEIVSIPLQPLTMQLLQPAEMLAEKRKETEKAFVSMAMQHPLYHTFVEPVRGLAALSFGQLLAESHREPGVYKSVAALWSRWGVAVFDGKRQQRISGHRKNGEAAEAEKQGFNPVRRAMLWQIGKNLMMQNKEEYRAVYEARKAYTLARGWTPGHADNDARRVMTKHLLKNLWQASRAQMAQKSA